MAKFEVVSRFADAGLPIPERKTADSAGYDFVVAEDIIIPSYMSLFDDMLNYVNPQNVQDLTDMAKITKAIGAKPTLVSTGMKCELDLGTYLELSVRSSCPLKHWLILANGVGRL